MNGLWYYQINGRQLGPVTTDRLRELVAEGVLAADDAVRNSREQDTQTVASALTDVVEHAAGKVTNESETTDFADHDVHDSVDQSVHPPGIESSSTREVHDDTAEFSDGTLNIDDFEIDETPSATSDQLLYLRSGPTEIGPFTPADLSRLADAGKISLTDEIRAENETDWRPASEEPRVMVALMSLDDSSSQSDSRVSAGSRSSRSKMRRADRKQGRRKTQAQHRRSLNASRQAKAKVDSIIDDVLAPDVPPASPIPLAVSRSHQVEASESVVDRKQDEAPSRKATEGTGKHGTAAAIDQPIATPPETIRSTPVRRSSQSWTSPVKPKRSRSTPSLPQLDAKVLGVAGGIAVAIAACYLLPSMLTFGPTLPDQTQVAAKLNELSSQYQSATASQDQWKQFGAQVRSEVMDWMKMYQEAAGARSPRDIELQEAATSLVQLVNSKIDDKDAHLKHLEQLKLKLSGGSDG